MEEINNKLNILVHSRLHLTLLALHNGEYRINGGLGVTIAQPACTLVFSKATIFSLHDSRDHPLTVEEADRLQTLLYEEQKQRGFDYALDIVLTGNMRPHAGFGSGTAVTLACLEALHLLNVSQATPTELIAASKRGGTSGVGIHSYFSGGYVFDLGRKIDGSPFMPSNQTGSKQLPLLLDQGPMPDWEFGICLPKGIPHKTQTEEREFFARTCPLPADSVYETVYHTLFGLYAALREADRSGFCHALKAIQTCAWKQAERQEYGKELLDIEQAIYSAGAEAVGMSSLGPSLFFLAYDVPGIIEKMRIARPDCDWLITYPDNQGRQIVYD
ncbi:MAG: beta-ribofuranosylaminobenzene 5'-phosphate synthase [Proteobacteria bacterium ST_bin11]|nr:MAG: beta-ribofuranosylaminobenzene 5'-phosphate synthase [Proteobacteria bacterium ST_bin11]